MWCEEHLPTLRIKNDNHSKIICNLTFWSFKFQANGASPDCTVLLCWSRPSGSEFFFFSPLIVPPWPGNYPNLPSSCAPARVPHWLRPPLWLHYQCWDSLMAWRPHRAGCRRRETTGAGEEEVAGGGGGEQGEEGRKNETLKSKGSALKVNISIMRDNSLKSDGFCFLNVSGHWRLGKATGNSSVK